MLRVCVFSLAILFAAPSGAVKYQKRANVTDVLDYVNPLIGSQKGGNVFAGATLPYGMAKGQSLAWMKQCSEISISSLVNKVYRAIQCFNKLLLL